MKKKNITSKKEILTTVQPRQLELLSLMETKQLYQKISEGFKIADSTWLKKYTREELIWVYS